MLGKKDFAIICPVEVAVSIIEESSHDLKKKHEIVRDTSMCKLIMFHIDKVSLISDDSYSCIFFC